MNVDRGSVRSVLANRAIVGGVVFTLIGVLSSFFLGVVFAGFWLAVGVSLLVGEFVDRLVGVEDRATRRCCRIREVV